MNGNSFIKEIGRSYIVSSFLPAALFVSLGVFIFHGFAPDFVVDGIQKTNYFLGFDKPNSLSLGSMFILFILTAWVAFYLYSSINWTVQLYEGYKFPHMISEILRYFIRYSWHRKQLRVFGAVQKEFEKKATMWNDELIVRRKIALAEVQNLEGYSPIDDDDLLPTRLGNVFRASELYADERYKLNSLVMFPKLIHVFPLHFTNELEEKNNRFIFLIHSSFLAYVIGGLAFTLGMTYKIISPFCNSTFMPKVVIRSFCDGGFVFRGFTILSSIEYMIIGFVFFAIGYILYRISVVAAREFALHIRAGFDLYRFNLLRQLNQRLPNTLNDEKQMWEILSEYFIAGNRLRFADIGFQYQQYEKSKSGQSRE